MDGKPRKVYMFKPKRTLHPPKGRGLNKDVILTVNLSAYTKSFENEYIKVYKLKEV